MLPSYAIRCQHDDINACQNHLRKRVALELSTSSLGEDHPLTQAVLTTLPDSADHFR